MTVLTQTAPKPRLLSSTPVKTFKVETGQDWKQSFAVLEYDAGFELVLVTKRGNRQLGQAFFPNPFQAERWATTQVTCNGPFDVY